MGIEGILPRAISRQIETYRLSLRARRYGSSMVRNVLSVVEDSADLPRIQRLWREMRPVFQKDAASAAKYANPRHWLLLNIYRAAQLGLHRERNFRILDIGCGPGYFMAVTRALGHECEGVDAPESYLTPIERRVYAELLCALGCNSRVSPLLIERFVSLPTHMDSYDLITAFWICFNRHKQADTWGVQEWQFFVEDAVRRLHPGGRLFLELNEDRERFGQLRYYDEPTLAYFGSIGTVEANRILITNGAATYEDQGSIPATARK